MDKILSYELLIHKGSPFELQDAVVRGIPCKIFPHGPQTLRDVFMKALSFASREFIVKDDTRLTFGQAFRMGNHFARNLKKKYKIKKGNHVAIIMEPGPEWAVAFIAACFADAVPVVIPVGMERRAAIKALELTNCDAMIADISSARKINLSGIQRPVVIPVMHQPDTGSHIDCGKAVGFSIFNLADAPDDKNEVCVNKTKLTTPEDEALISFTSGTTGKPKGVAFSHRNITTGLMNMMLGGLRMSLRATRDGRKQPPGTQTCSLLLSPFSHIGGYSQLMLMCYLGGKIVLMPEWDTRRATVLIENERIRSLCGLSQTMARDLFRANRFTNNLQSLTHMNIYGVALQRKFIRELAKEFPHISLGTGYGTTETCGAISVVSGMELLDNPKLGGLTLPSVNIKIVDHLGREALQGKHGEIWVRGAMVMRGYCSIQDDSIVALQEGWLKTGDLGYVDHTGNLYIAGRIDMLQCRKKQVSSGKLERIVCELDTVDEAAALRTSGRDAKIALAVIPNSAIQIDKNELAREVSACVKSYTDDIRVVAMDDFPRTSSGKVDRRALHLQIGEKYA